MSQDKNVSFEQNNKAIKTEIWIYVRHKGLVYIPVKLLITTAPLKVVHNKDSQSGGYLIITRKPKLQLNYFG